MPFSVWDRRKATFTCHERQLEGMNSQQVRKNKQTNHYYQNPLRKLRCCFSHFQMLPPCLSYLNQNSWMFHACKIPDCIHNGCRWRIKFLIIMGLNCLQRNVRKMLGIVSRIRNIWLCQRNNIQTLECEKSHWKIMTRVCNAIGTGNNVAEEI